MLRPKLNLVIQDPASGRARPGAWVSIFVANTRDIAALFADDDATGLQNPLQANGLGQLAVRIAPGIYDVEATWDGTQPTLIEDVLAWTPAETVLTTPGDLLVMSAGGMTRLAIGLDGQFLTVDAGMPAWATLGPGVGLPEGAAGSMLRYGAGDTLAILAPGTHEQVLQMLSGTPSWVSSLLPAGTTLPISAEGDLVVGGPGGGVMRLPVGDEGDVLMVSDGAVIWSGNIAGSISRGGGECMLYRDSSVYPAEIPLRLIRYNGNQIWIAGQSRTLPDPGPVLLPTGLTVDTTYYIYATWADPNIVLVASTTPPSLTGGLSHKGGDETQTFVGMARCVGAPGAPGWFDGEHRRLVASYFNRRTLVASAFYTAPRAYVNTAIGEIHPEIRTEFVVIEGGAVIGDTNRIMMAVTGIAQLTAGTGAKIWLSEVAGANIANISLPVETTENWRNITFLHAKGMLTPGYHVLTLKGENFGPGALTVHGFSDGMGAGLIQVSVT